jgi:SAM-dependent methyltransferase
VSEVAYEGQGAFDIANFWQQRLRTTGHTGWYDPFIYAFDQRERLCLINTKVSAHAVGGSALDFGCGTGDFSRLLLGLGFIVWGYDPYVRPSIRHNKFKYVNNLSFLSAQEGSIDIILSVTVLGHIVDDDELAHNLVLIKRLLSPRGRLLMLEYAFDKASPSDIVTFATKYQAIRTLEQWRDFLRRSSLQDIYMCPFPNPINSPSIAYQNYERNLMVRLLRKICGDRSSFPGRDFILAKIAKGLVNRSNNTLEDIKSSPLKFIECIGEL